jgi:hypothetical protein
VTGGEFAGERGRLERAAWHMNASLDLVDPGPPGGYMVNLGRVPDTERVERVLAEHLVPEDESTDNGHADG